MARMFCLNLFLFLAAAAPLSFYLSELDRYPDILGDKLAYYEGHADEFDTLVVGSSYTHFGLDPRAMDAALRERGLEASTFNLAVFGLLGHEVDETIRLALKADRNRRLKRVIIDMRPLEPGKHVLFANTEYEVWWHSLHQTAAVLRTLWKSRQPMQQKVRLTLHHLALMVENHLPLGTALRLKKERERDPEETWFRRTFDEFRGVEIIDSDKEVKFFIEDQSNVTWDMLMQRDRMLSDPERVEQLRAELVEKTTQRDDLADANVDFWRRQTRMLNERGILPVHLAMPAFYNPFITRGPALLEAGALDHFLSFNDPRVYPTLFLEDHRFEFGHLNHKGTAIFSRMLGEAIAELEAGGTLAAPSAPLHAE